MDSFYKGFPGEFFPRKSFVKFFWNFKLESDFFPHFFCKIRKIENSAHLFILNYNWANFQRNRRQKNSSLHFTSLHLRSRVLSFQKLQPSLWLLFFEQNQKTRTLWKFLSWTLSVLVSAKSETKKFFTSLTHSLHFTSLTSLTTRTDGTSR